MKVFIWIIIIFVLFVIVFVFIQRDNKVIKEIVLHPKDYFGLIISVPLNIKIVDDTIETNVFLKYKGKYAIGVLLERFNDELYRKKYDIALKIKLEFYEDNKLVFTSITANEYYPFFGKNGNGLMLKTLAVPDDLPLNKNMLLKVSVVSPDKYLDEHFGPAKIYVQKISDL